MHVRPNNKCITWIVQATRVKGNAGSKRVGVGRSRRLGVIMVRMAPRDGASSAAGPEADEPKGIVDACCSTVAGIAIPPEKVEDEKVTLYLGEFSGSAVRFNLRGRDASSLLARLEALPSWPSVRASLVTVLQNAAGLVDNDSVLVHGKVDTPGLPPLAAGPEKLPSAVMDTHRLLREATRGDGRVLSSSERLQDAFSLGRGDWALWREASRGVIIHIEELRFRDLRATIYVVLRDCNMQGPYVLFDRRSFLKVVGSLAGQRVSALGRGFPSKSEAVAYITGLGLQGLPRVASCNELEQQRVVVSAS
jgi:hypothetical protein